MATASKQNEGRLNTRMVDSSVPGHVASFLSATLRRAFVAAACRWTHSVHPIVVSAERASHSPGDLPASRAVCEHSTDRSSTVGSPADVNLEQEDDYQARAESQVPQRPVALPPDHGYLIPSPCVHRLISSTASAKPPERLPTPPDTGFTDRSKANSHNDSARRYWRCV